MRIILLVAVFCVNIVSKAQDMKTIFATMPENFVVQLDSLKRRDLIDLHTDSISDNINDNLSGVLRIEKFTNDYLKITSGNSVYEIGLLPLVNETPVICFIETVCAPVCDSRLQFFTTAWKPLENDDFIEPFDSSWFYNDKADYQDQYFVNASKALDMDLVEYRLDIENKTLSQSYNTPEYLSKEDKKAIAPYLKNEIRVFEWKRMGFR